MFERRHSSAVAEVLRLARQRPNDSAQEALDDLIEDFKILFLRDNHSFNAERFDAATRTKRGRPPLKPGRFLEKRQQQIAELAAPVTARVRGLAGRQPTPMGEAIIKRAKAGYVFPAQPEAPRQNRGRP
jgi:hypothetical protein